MKIKMVALLILLCSQSLHANSFSVTGGAIKLTQTIPVSGPSFWHLTVRSSQPTFPTNVEVRCNSSSAIATCSSFTSGVPTLLNTGGCHPVQEAIFFEEELVRVWVCGGSGTGRCVVSSGFLSTNPRAQSITLCF